MAEDANELNVLGTTMARGFGITDYEFGRAKACHARIGKVLAKIEEMRS